MPWKDFSVPYKMILNDLKSKGIKVYHRKLGKDEGGFFNRVSGTISIAKDRRETEEGCYLLLHEYIHYLQYRNNEIPWFFSKDFRATDENIDQIIEVELDTSRRAVKLGKQFGISYIPDELKDSTKQRSILFWRNYYLSDK